jgi:hypothetical protein
MSEWRFAQSRPEQKLAEVRFFSVIKVENGREIEFRITIKEFAEPKDRNMHFFAEADRFVYQKSAPHRPTGWGATLLKALGDCVKAIEQFPTEEEEF